MASYRLIEDSSWIQGASYLRIPCMEGMEKWLVIHTTRGDSLYYSGAKPWMFGLLLASKSKGRFFNNYIRGLPFWKTDDCGVLHRVA